MHPGLPFGKWLTSLNCERSKGCCFFWLYFSQNIKLDHSKAIKPSPCVLLPCRDVIFPPGRRCLELGSTEMKSDEASALRPLPDAVQGTCWRCSLAAGACCWAQRSHNNSGTLAFFLRRAESLFADADVCRRLGGQITWIIQFYSFKTHRD